MHWVHTFKWHLLFDHMTNSDIFQETFEITYETKKKSTF